MFLDTVELPDDLEWIDEFAWTPVTQNLGYGATGSLFIQESEKQAGRTITLQGAENMCWVSRATVLALQALFCQTNKEMTLTLSDARSFTVRFRQSDTPIDVSAVAKGAFYADEDYFKINTINLIEVADG